MRMRRGRVTGWSPVAVAVGALLTPTSAGAQTMTTSVAPPPQPITVAVIEFDLPSFGDIQPGAMVVDTQGNDRNRVWFVTRLGNPGMPQRVIRVDPAKSMMKASAQWTSWDLSETTGFTGGLRRIRPSNDRRFVFVRTAVNIQRIDTQACDNVAQTCQRTVWTDQAGENVSDVAIDDRNNVFTTFATVPLDPTNFTPADAALSYVQMLTPGPFPGNITINQGATVTHWQVGGGAGFCQSASTSGPCLSGIAVHPNKRNLVYYSEPGGRDPVTGVVLFGNNIGELNTLTNQVRRWSLSAVGAFEPRQLQLTNGGNRVWVVTGSGDLVSLDPINNKMTLHQMPGMGFEDPFGVAPDDDVVGYTGTGLNIVGMVHPRFNPIPVTPITTTITPTTAPVDVAGEPAVMRSGTADPHRKLVAGTVSRKGDGIFVEADINTSNDPSTEPLGISPNKGKAQGTFFYAVGINATTNDPNQPNKLLRFGFVRFRLQDKVVRPRDDDDPNDGWTGTDAGTFTPTVGDNDGDGLDDAYDNPTNWENVQVGNPTAIGGGGFADFTVATTTTSLALIATAVGDNPLNPIAVEVYNPGGLLVANSAPTGGVAAATVALPLAGTYTVRVKNYGMTGVTSTPTLIVREPTSPF